MPAPTNTTMIPADAMEKADAKGTDYYADMTDEERSEEGLPPREPAKADPAPGDKTPETPAEKEEEIEEEPTGEQDDDATERLFKEIAGLNERLDERLPGKAPTSTDEKAQRLQAALESDDESTRFLAEQLVESNNRLAAVEAREIQERIDRQALKDDADFEAVQTAYLIGGKPMTDAQVEKVEIYMRKNPEAGAILTIEEATRRVFPSATKAPPKSPSAKGPGDVLGSGPKVATIVDSGSAGGGAPSGKWQPKPNETVESAVAAAGRALLGVKR